MCSSPVVFSGSWESSKFASREALSYLYLEVMFLVPYFSIVGNVGSYIIGGLSTTMGMYGYVWVCMCMYGYLWVSMGVYGYVFY